MSTNVWNHTCVEQNAKDSTHNRHVHATNCTLSKNCAKKFNSNEARNEILLPSAYNLHATRTYTILSLSLSSRVSSPFLFYFTIFEAHSNHIIRQSRARCNWFNETGLIVRAIVHTHARWQQLGNFNPSFVASFSNGKTTMIRARAVVENCNKWLWHATDDNRIALQTWISLDRSIIALGACSFFLRTP